MPLPESLLIANRGEIACRIIRTAKRLGIKTVAVYSEADKDALHVKAADQAVEIGPAPVIESYLKADRIIDAAKSTGAQAIHPGYGLLSEKESFAKAVADAGLTFVGPSPDVLAAFGDKIRAREVARAANVEPPPGTDGPLSPADEEKLISEAERIGYPVLIKTAGGGGGIGLAVVEKPEKLVRAANQCADRGRSAFNDDRVYMERYLQQPRHIEVQVLCDDHGNAVALGERECSAQRRHQKIIEESPSPASFFSGADGEERRRKLHESALAVVKHVGYRGAGTVEFVADASGQLFFLEVNARLQVEHCVTEMVTKCDLVEQQLRIAGGMPIADDVLQAKLAGHSIEARVYAEDPMKRFAPQPGKLEKLSWPDDGDRSALRIETGVAEGDTITPYYDPMIAKVVVWGPSRDEAIARLDKALDETTLELVGPAGPANTNIAFLRQMLAHEAFADGNYDTQLAEQFAKELRKG